jgi:hypothetical protein
VLGLPSGEKTAFLPAKLGRELDKIKKMFDRAATPRENG